MGAEARPYDADSTAEMPVRVWRGGFSSILNLEERILARAADFKPFLQQYLREAMDEEVRIP